MASFVAFEAAGTLEVTKKVVEQLLRCGLSASAASQSFRALRGFRGCLWFKLGFMAAPAPPQESWTNPTLSHAAG